MNEMMVDWTKIYSAKKSTHDPSSISGKYYVDTIKKLMVNLPKYVNFRHCLVFNLFKGIYISELTDTYAISQDIVSKTTKII
jgi:hypothetical protein